MGISPHFSPISPISPHFAPFPPHFSPFPCRLCLYPLPDTPLAGSPHPRLGTKSRPGQGSLASQLRGPGATWLPQATGHAPVGRDPTPAGTTRCGKRPLACSPELASQFDAHTTQLSRLRRAHASGGEEGRARRRGEMGGGGMGRNEQMRGGGVGGGGTGL